MSVLERDPEATARCLERWFTEVAALTDVEVTGITIPGSTGWSNETVLFDASWRQGGEVVQQGLVARIAPGGYTVFPDDTFAMQYEVMRALADRPGVPMAPVHRFEPSPEWFGQPFWIMDRIDGDIVSDAPHYAGEGWLHDASLADQERAWWSGVDAMAAIHVLPLAELAAPTLVVPADPVAAVLDHCERYLTWAEDGRPHPAAREALARLRGTAPPPPAEGLALSWGDSRLSNLIYRDFDVVAVLDWEMATIGDPLLDLGWWLFADDALTKGWGHDRLPGFPTVAATAERWAARTGRSTEALGWYELLAALRFTIIMLRMGKLLHGLELVPAEFPYDNLISQALDVRLDGAAASPGGKL